jgi:alkylation response protein AidB-like acyl-CoA dehydrogenase
MSTQPSAQSTNDIIAAAQALAPLIQESLPTMETENRLPLPLVAALRELGVFRLAIPRAYGGLDAGNPLF